MEIELRKSNLHAALTEVVSTLNRAHLERSACWSLDSVPSPTEALRAPGQPEVTLISLSVSLSYVSYEATLNTSTSPTLFSVQTINHLYHSIPYALVFITCKKRK